MPIISGRTRGKHFVRFVSRLEHENNETFYAFAHFIGEGPEYLLNQLVDTVLAPDADYRAWRVQHPDSFAPARKTRQPRRRRRGEGHSRERAGANDDTGREIPGRDA
jgi:hypothetical protein